MFTIISIAMVLSRAGKGSQVHIEGKNVVMSLLADIVLFIIIIIVLGRF